MKIKSLLIVYFLSCFSLQSNAQIYTAGDISVFVNVTGFHDSAQCASFSFGTYQFTISNSFLGDSILIKDMSTGSLILSDVNTTGSNPWMTSLPIVNMIPMVPDNQISAGYASFMAFPVKICSGPDTAFNVFSFFNQYVPNPCNYANVSGKIYIDNNSDCLFNTGDVALQSLMVTTNPSYSSPVVSISQNGYTNINGNYNIQLTQSWLNNFTVSLPPSYAFIFPSTSCSPISYTYNSLPQSTADFSLQCTSQIDVQSAAMGPGAARPLIPFMLHPFVSNTGCNTASGILTLIKDPNTIYNAALSSNPASSVSGDTLNWNFTNLTNLSTGAYWNSFMSGVHLTPNASVNIGDTLCFSVSSTVLTSDINPLNNQSSFCIPIVNSYDPNEKEVSPKGIGTTGQIPLSTNQLNYTIHFQNTGTATAYNISIVDTLDPNIIPSSLQILGTSHIMTPEWLSSNVVRYNFYSIMLPDSNTNEPMSHGQISYSVKLNSGLPIGTQIKNKASIYFDSNPAIVTNTTLNTITGPTSNVNIVSQHSISFYPNPADDHITISLSEQDQSASTSLTIYSINGVILKHVSLSKENETLNISELTPGIYFVKVMNENHTEAFKFVKK